MIDTIPASKYSKAAGIIGKYSICTVIVPKNIILTVVVPTYILTAVSIQYVSRNWSPIQFSHILTHFRAFVFLLYNLHTITAEMYWCIFLVHFLYYILYVQAVIGDYIFLYILLSLFMMP